MSKLKVAGIKALENCKVGFYDSEEHTVYVSPAVASLATSDLKLLKDLQVFKRPKGKFDTLEEFILDVCERHLIFGLSEDERKSLDIEQREEDPDHKDEHQAPG